MFDNLTGRLQGAFKKLRGLGKITEENIKEVMKEVRLALLSADVNFQVTRDFIQRVKDKAVGEDVLLSLDPSEQVIKVVFDELVELLGKDHQPIELVTTKPTVVMLVGLQGSGKTTSCGKLALQFKKQGKKVLLVAADIYRPAAIQQLQTIGRQVDVPVLTIPGAKPQELATAALEQARAEGVDLLIIDTAGRLQIDEQLMQELVDVRAIASPNEVLFVADGMTGQEAVNVAESFHQRVGISGVVLTKMDGDARGGAALSIRHVTGVPIKYMGVGEKLDLLEPFRPDGIARRILGMGDFGSILDKVQQAFEEDDVKRMQEQMEKNRFTLEDFYGYIQQVKRMGSVGGLLELLPAAMKPKDISNQEVADQAEHEMKRVEAMIQSMTKQERKFPDLLKKDKNRRKRVAAGAGVGVSDLKDLLRQYDEAKVMFERISMLTRGGLGGMLGKGLGSLLGRGGGLPPGMPQMPPGMMPPGGMPGMMGAPRLGAGTPTGPRLSGSALQKEKKKKRKKR